MRILHVFCSNQNLSFRTAPINSGKSFMELQITAAFPGLSSAVPFLSYKYWFKYRPNPIVEEVQPGTTILR